MICVKNTIINSVCCVFAVILAGCSMFNDTLPTNTLSSTNLPNPLVLNSVEWSVINLDDNVKYCVNTSNFSNLSLNMQLAQDRLYLYQSIIENQNKTVDSK